MAEYCKDCVSKMLGWNVKRYHVHYFSGVDVCEGCEQVKKLVCRFTLLGDIADTRHMYKELKGVQNDDKL